MSKLQNYINNEDITLLDSIYNFKKDLSKKAIKNFIKNGMVMVNNKVITNSSYLLSNGDKIEISYEKKESINSELEILYEDNYLIAINKPCSLLSIGNDKEKIVTAYRMVSDYVKDNNKGKYIFVVHRLDQETSGVLLFAKNEKIRDTLQNNWNNMVKKRGYLAIVEGKLTGSDTIHTYLREDKRQFVYSAKGTDGKEAITHYSVIKNNNHYSLLQVFIDTGRRNQIRVHLSEKGYPIMGDKKYLSKTNPIKRLALHANILEFIHPVTKKLIHIESKIPKEMADIIKTTGN